MKFKKENHFQLVQVDPLGNQYPLTLRPGVPLPLFKTKKEADTWVGKNPEQITVTPKSYTVLPISTLERIKKK